MRSRNRNAVKARRVRSRHRIKVTTPIPRNKKKEVATRILSDYDSNGHDKEFMSRPLIKCNCKKHVTTENIRSQLNNCKNKMKRRRDQFSEVTTDLTNQTSILRRDKLLKSRPKTVSWAIDFREIHLEPWNQAQFLKVINRRTQF